MDFSALAEAAKHGDVAAFASLYSEVYKDMYKFAFYTLGHREDAEDAVADAVTAAYGQIARLKSAEAFRPWIFRILSNICRRTLKTYVHKTAELDEEIPCREADFTENAVIRAVFGCLADPCIFSAAIQAGKSEKFFT